jgi:hypothetical protein
MSAIRGSLLRIRIVPNRRDLRRMAVVLGLVLLAAVWLTMLRMPGRSHEGPLPPLTPEQRALAVALHADVRVLASDIGPRNTFRPAALERAADWIESRLESTGLVTRRQTFEVDGLDCSNVIAEVGGTIRPDEIVVVGAHYDTCGSSEGAALPGVVPGVDLSDHWSFWQVGVPALMVTDTAMFRYDWYHDRGDRPERLDDERMARVVDGLDAVVVRLAE